MKHTLGTAAKATGVSKSTIYRAVKSGKLSASRNDDGEYEIDPAELHRVYEPVSKRAGNDETEREATPADTGNDTMLAFMRDQVLAAQAKAEAAEAEAEQVKAELQDTAQRLQEHREAARLLIDPETFQQKEQAWKESLEARRAEIEQARHDANELAEQLKQESEQRAKAEALTTAMQGRGWLARLLNKKPDVVL